MAKHTYEGVQYAPYGDGWVKRADPSEDWEAVELEAVPFEVRAEEYVVAKRHVTGVTPTLGIVREPHPTLDAIAEELGLTPDELRLRLNDTSSDGTRTRVEEKRWGAIAKALGMSVKELEDRLAGRHPALRDPSRPGAV